MLLSFNKRRFRVFQSGSLYVIILYFLFFTHFLTKSWDICWEWFKAKFIICGCTTLRHHKAIHYEETKNVRLGCKYTKAKLF